MAPKMCSFKDCPKPHLARGYCSGHYEQLRSGKPLRVIQKGLSIAERFASYIDKSGDCWEWTGAKTPLGYPRFGGSAYAHRLSWEMENGAIPLKGEIDHICHNPGCVRPSHLRLATRKQNIENHSGPKKNCKSGVRGVCFDKKTQKWAASVRHDGVIYRLGYYVDLDEAAVAVVAKRNELHSYNDADRTQAA
jgi:hypothetical protein